MYINLCNKKAGTYIIMQDSSGGGVHVAIGWGTRLEAGRVLFLFYVGCGGHTCPVCGHHRHLQQKMIFTSVTNMDNKPLQCL